jgi:hypothetical protein
MTAEEAGALLKQLDSMIVTLAGTRPLSDEEALQAGKQLAPVVPGLLGKLTPETVAVFGLALLYGPRIDEVWATRRARDAARKAGAVEGATAQPEFRVELDGGPKTSEQPPRPITDREALGLGIVKERADPIR